MSTSKDKDSSTHENDWDRFHQLIVTQKQVKEVARPHIARWINQWKRQGGENSEIDTLTYFDSLIKSGPADWKFHQAIFAVEFWCTRIQTPNWATHFDWKTLSDRMETLEHDHPSRLQDTIPVQHGTFSPSVLSHRDKTPVPDEKRLVNDLIERARRAIRLKDYAASTERTYLDWIRKFSYFRLRRRRELLDVLTEEPVEAYLEYVALERLCSASSQRQALNAIIFLARHVYHLPKELELRFVVRESKRRPPTVFSRPEVKEVIAALPDPWKLMSELAYGTGMRQIEVLRLRVKDLDPGRGIIYVHDGKGGKHRTVPLPRTLEEKLMIT